MLDIGLSLMGFMPIVTGLQRSLVQQTSGVGVDATKEDAAAHLLGFVP